MRWTQLSENLWDLHWTWSSAQVITFLTTETGHEICRAYLHTEVCCFVASETNLPLCPFLERFHLEFSCTNKEGEMITGRFGCRITGRLLRSIHSFLQEVILLPPYRIWAIRCTWILFRKIQSMLCIRFLLHLLLPASSLSRHGPTEVQLPVQAQSENMTGPQESKGYSMLRPALPISSITCPLPFESSLPLLCPPVPTYWH